MCCCKCKCLGMWEKGAICGWVVSLLLKQFIFWSVVVCHFVLCLRQ